MRQPLRVAFKLIKEHMRYVEIRVASLMGYGYNYGINKIEGNY